MLEDYIWLSIDNSCFATFTEWHKTPGFMCTLVAPSQDDGNAHLAALETKWNARRTTYNASVHGSWDPRTRAPFFRNWYAKGKQSPTVWSLSSKESLGFFTLTAYDAIWMYAHALDRLVSAGIDPRVDGPALRSALRQYFGGLLWSASEILGKLYKGSPGPMIADTYTK